MFVEGPRPNYERPREITCTHDVAWPLVDLLWLALGIARVASTSDGTQVNLGLAIGATAAFSAGYGVWNVQRCNEVTAPAPISRRKPSLTTPPLPAPPPSPAAAVPDAGMPAADAGAAPAPAAVPQQVDPE
jgi:hypothetical protein